MFSKKLQDLIKKANALGISKMDIRDCGKNIQCLESKILAKQIEIKKKEEEKNYNFKMPKLSDTKIKDEQEEDNSFGFNM